jgi:hydroxymethylpyrimidine kinase/phosphomethylpyrimidine kinase
MDQLNDIGDVDGLVQAAKSLAELGVETVVVKGGHLTGPTSPDVVVHRGAVTIVESPRIASINDHGTGCTLSAAIAAWLAKGRNPVEAVQLAKQYVTGALGGATGWRLGAGRGPLDHFGWGSGRQ